MQEQNRKSSFPIVMLLVSVALWIASLSNVAFYLGNHGSMEGLTVLILGVDICFFGYQVLCGLCELCLVGGHCFAGVAEEGRACPCGTLGLGVGGFQCESRIRR